MATRSTRHQVRLIRAADLSDSEHDAWRRLADRAVEPNPFFRPEFVLAARGLQPATLLVVGDERDWSLCLPVHAARRWRRVLLPVLAPWLPAYAYLATPLVDRSSVEPAVAALARFAGARRRTAALVLDPIDPSGPVATALMSTPMNGDRRRPPVVSADFERPAVRRRDRPDYLEAAMSARRRKELRRQRRALDRATGGALTMVDRSGDPAADESFLRLERASWKGDGGTALASTSEGAAFFRALCAGMRARGSLQTLALEAAGTPIAMQCNLLDGEVLFGFKVAYDRAWSRFSPGALLEVDALEEFHHRTSAAMLDSCSAPGNPLLTRLWPDRRPMQTMLLPAASAIGGLVGPAVRAEAALRRWRRARTATATAPGGRPAGS